MIILAIKTDQPESEFWLLKDHKTLGHIKYLAHQNLARTIHLQISKLLKNQNLDWPDIEGLVAYKGPGSFTGLRIGLTVANSLAYSLKIPIIGEKGDDWLESGVTKLQANKNDKIVIPFYGAEPHITQAKK
jgi:tRNA threonylcarbamoyladenosine biosynthesis protein TsaB